MVAASNSLGRLCTADRAALDVLASLDRPVDIDPSGPAALARSKRLELLRIAARDLLGMDNLDDVGRGADMAAAVLTAARPGLSSSDGGEFAVIGMGKLGGGELNYASDVDVMFVTDRPPETTPARALSGHRPGVLPGRCRPETRRTVRCTHAHSGRLPLLLGPASRRLGVPGPAQGPAGGRLRDARPELRHRGAAGHLEPGLQRR